MSLCVEFSMQIRLALNSQRSTGLKVLGLKAWATIPSQLQLILLLFFSSKLNWRFSIILSSTNLVFSSIFNLLFKRSSYILYPLFIPQKQVACSFSLSLLSWLFLYFIFLPWSFSFFLHFKSLTGERKTLCRPEETSAGGEPGAGLSRF